MSFTCFTDYNQLIKDFIPNRKKEPIKFAKK